MSSPTQSLQYFGRTWQISITPQNGEPQITFANIAGSPSLRVEFDAEEVLGQPIWQAKVTIYNLGNSLSTSIANGAALTALYSAVNKPNTTAPNTLSLNANLTMGDFVQIAAGYQLPAAGRSANALWSGNILQSIATRENVTDARLILRCVANLAANVFNHVAFPQAAMATDWDALNNVLQGAQLPLESTDQSSQLALQAQKYPRAQAYFDRPFNLIDRLTKQHNLYYWTTPNGLNLRSFNSAPTNADYAYGPPNVSQYTTNGGTLRGIVKPTLLGYPEGTQEGIAFRVLLDPDVKIGDVVQIAAPTAINSYQFVYSGQNGETPPLPNPQGLYFVAGIRHVGDTRGRGDDWYTEITGLTPKFFFTRAAVYGLGQTSPSPSGN